MVTNEQLNAAIAEHLGLSEVKPYATDLNEIHRAVQSLTPSEQNAFIDYLGAVYCGSWDFANATARQRSEVFVCVVGKWTWDEPIPMPL